MNGARHPATKLREDRHIRRRSSSYVQASSRSPAPAPAPALRLRLPPQRRRTQVQRRWGHTAAPWLSIAARMEGRQARKSVTRLSPAIALACLATAHRQKAPNTAKYGGVAPVLFARQRNRTGSVHAAVKAGTSHSRAAETEHWDQPAESRSAIAARMEATTWSGCSDRSRQLKRRTSQPAAIRSF